MGNLQWWQKVGKKSEKVGKTSENVGEKSENVGKTSEHVGKWMIWMVFLCFFHATSWENDRLVKDGIVQPCYQRIFCLIQDLQDGCTDVTDLVHACLVHVIQSHRCEKAKVEQYESLSSNLWEPKAIGFFQPEAAQRWGKSVRMSFSFMFIWKPPIFCWFPSASFSSNCVYDFVGCQVSFHLLVQSNSGDNVRLFSHSSSFFDAGPRQVP